MTDRLHRSRVLADGYQYGDAGRVILTALRAERAKIGDVPRVDGRADRSSLSGGDREPDDFEMGGGVPSWTVVDRRLVRLPPLPNMHKMYREYREWVARQEPFDEWPGFEWDPPKNG